MAEDIKTLTKSWSNELLIYINGKPVKIRDPDPTVPLLTYLRNNAHLTGAKLVCGEGACGACTVMVSRYDAVRKRIT